MKRQGWRASSKFIQRSTTRLATNLNPLGMLRIDRDRMETDNHTGLTHPLPPYALDQPHMSTILKSAPTSQLPTIAIKLVQILVLVVRDNLEQLCSHSLFSPSVSRLHYRLDDLVPRYPCCSPSFFSPSAGLSSSSKCSHPSSNGLGNSGCGASKSSCSLWLD